MAYCTSVTISTGNKVSVNYQSQDVSVSLTYQLEREDADLLALVERKADEVERAHRRVWQRIRDQRQSEQAANNSANASNGAQKTNGAPAGSTAAKRTRPNGTRTKATTTPVKPTTAENHLPPSVAPESPKTEGAQPLSGPEPVSQPVPAQLTNGIPAQELGLPQPTAIPSQRPITETQLRAIHCLATRLGITDEDLSRRINMRFGRQSLEELKELQATNLILELQRNAPVTTAARTAPVPVQANGSGEVPHGDESEGGNRDGNKTRSATV